MVPRNHQVARSAVSAGREILSKTDKDSFPTYLRLKIGDCEIPEPVLSYVVLSIGPFPVSFGGVAGREEGAQIRKRLRLLAEEKAIPYDAVDKNGVASSGLCNIRDLKFEERPTTPGLIRFSGRLVHPFI